MALFATWSSSWTAPSRDRSSEPSGNHAIARVRASKLAWAALSGSWLNFSSVSPCVIPHRTTHGQITARSDSLRRPRAIVGRRIRTITYIAVPEGEDAGRRRRWSSSITAWCWHTGAGRRRVQQLQERLRCRADPRRTPCQLTTTSRKRSGSSSPSCSPDCSGLYALSLHIDVLGKWLQSATSTAAGTVGAFFLVPLLALGFGVFISGVRSELIDRFWWSKECPKMKWSTRREGRGRGGVPEPRGSALPACTVLRQRRPRGDRSVLVVAVRPEQIGFQFRTRRCDDSLVGRLVHLLVCRKGHAAAV